jgi:hypothetical protein
MKSIALHPHEVRGLLAGTCPWATNPATWVFTIGKEK